MIFEYELIDALYEAQLLTEYLYQENYEIKAISWGIKSLLSEEIP